MFPSVVVVVKLAELSPLGSLRMVIVQLLLRVSVVLVIEVMNQGENIHWLKKLRLILRFVFAKFLNQDSSFQPEYMAMGQELPNDQACTQANSLTPYSAVIECDDKLTDLLIQECDSFLEGLCLPPAIVRDHQQQERIQELIESHEMVQDYSYLWSEAAATLSNATWETVVEPQEEFISSFSMDDELKISLIK